MSSEVAFTDPCPCGSGEKYKDCCGQDAATLAAQTRNKIIAGLILIAAVGGTYLYSQRADEEEMKSIQLPPGSVFDEGHGHWHDANDQELRSPGKIWNYERRVFMNAPEQRQGLFPQPAGDAPEGKVWSMEHGHWHDVTPNTDEDGQSPQTSFPQPPGPVPDGKVWSPEHGHWHDVN